MTPEVQRFYAELRARAPLAAAEDQIQRAVLAAHGGLTLSLSQTHQGGVLRDDDDDLAAYRVAVGRHCGDSALREKVFFLRNNICVPAAPLGSAAPDGLVMPLVRLRQPAPAGLMLPPQLELGNLRAAAQRLGLPALVLLCGSFT